MIIKNFWKHADLKKKVYNSWESYLINKMLEHKKFVSKKINWFDVGNTKSLNLTKRNFEQKNIFKILKKDKEDIFFTNKKVIKFHEDKIFIRERFKRSKILNKFVPQIQSYSRNYYSYNFIEGSIFSSKLSLRNFNLLLKFLEKFLDE